ncbi:BSP-domain-containing protein [Hypoxylon sp. FL1284]|nr:BSP-domain-containing protein [Hypoxylon sp. FL1284]
MSRPDPDRNLSGASNLGIHLTLSTRDTTSESITSQATKPTPSMPLPPDTTPVPEPVFMPGMSHRTEAPAPTSIAVPKPPGSKKTEADPQQPTTTKKESGDEEPPLPIELPRLRLHIEDAGHEGASTFLSSVNATAVLRAGIQDIAKHLYTPSPSHLGSSSHPALRPPPTRSVTLILRAMDGVAYTTGSDLDSDHKEIHLSLRYIASVTPASRLAAEMAGVVTHELVHCYQWNGLGAAPGGLVEGVADWVRLRCGLAPPHWRPGDVPGRWDAGYQHTAYLLQYLEDRFGDGTVRRLNDKLRRGRYEEKAFWTELLGRPIEQLFEDYKATFGKER